MVTLTAGKAARRIGRFGAVGLAVLAVELAACGGSSSTTDGLGGAGSGGSGGGGRGGGMWSFPQLSPWPELAPPMLDTGGGSARSTGGQGQAAGEVRITSAGAVSMAPAWPLATPVEVPSVPGGATLVGAADLGADVTVGGTIHLDGDITTAGGEPVRQITANGGDIFLTGTLRSADLGAGRQGITLNAPNGTVYVAGHLDTSGANPNGQAGGAIAIAAGRVVVTGMLSSQGGDSAAVGGAGGAITITATGEVVVAGKVRLRGGAAHATAGDATGGAAGVLTIDTAGAVQLAGSIDARGGFVTSDAPGAVVAGTGGSVLVGATTPPASVALLTSVSLKGGEGAAAGGMGGNFIVTMVAIAGDFTVAAGMDANLDGGACTGAGRAGGGGHLDFRCMDCNLSMAGKLSGRGGEALSGEGGLGGQFNILTDSNANGIGGNLTVTAEGVIDGSGGNGAVGGSARNDGTWDVAIFPQGIESIAVLLNSDGLHGTPRDGVTVNLGRIIVRGGASGGAGGDVEFHGKGLDGADDPSPGSVDSSADGTGMPGQVLME
jgi:hypothetical protein